MCGMGESTATISNEVLESKTSTKEQKKAATAQLAEKYGLNDKDPMPGLAPDLGAQLLRKAGATSLLAKASGDRRSSFLTGAMGDVTKPLVKKQGAY